jgi:Tol biopolymer transport system component
MIEWCARSHVAVSCEGCMSKRLQLPFVVLVLASLIVGLCALIILGRRHTNAGPSVAYLVQEIDHDQGYRDIARIQLGSKRSVRLTRKRVITGTYEFNSDAQAFVFTVAGGDDKERVCTLDIDGTSLKEIVGSDCDPSDPTWNPSGTQVAFSSLQGGFRAICVVDADGGSRKTVTKSRGQDIEPRWSPDGKWIAFVRVPVWNRGMLLYATSSIWAVDLRSGTEYELVPANALNDDLAWGPDSKKIVFASSTNCSGDALRLYVVDIAERQVTALPDAGGRAKGPVWSPQGDRIAFSCGEDGGVQDVYVVNPDGTNLRRVTTDRKYGGGVSWFPDGRRLVYGGFREGAYRICVTDIESMMETVLQTSRTYIGSPIVLDVPKRGQRG